MTTKKTLEAARDTILAAMPSYGLPGTRDIDVATARLNCRAAVDAIDAALAEQQAEPIDMVLHCPACGMQHIDNPSESCRHDYCVKEDPCERGACHEPWDNPPHRSHLCHNCGHVWRPADVPTNGVVAVKTKGKNDSPIAQQAEPSADALNAEVELPHAYLLTKLALVMPVFQEARDALTAISETQRVLHGISNTLAERMDAAGTYSIDDWTAQQ